MRKQNGLSVPFIIIAFLVSFTIGQTPASSAKNSLVAGDVISVDSGKLVFAGKDGEVTAVFSDKTEFKKIPANDKRLAAAVAAAITDIGSGDKIVVSGVVSDDKRSVAARTVYLMSKSELAEQQTKDLEKWQTRGVTGKIKALSADTKQITVEISSIMGNRTVVISPKPGVKFKRYAPNSIKYSEAVGSSFGEIAVGDGIRAVGDKSADGASLAAEEILTGSFQTHAGTVKTVDAAKNEVVMTDLQTKKDVTVSLAQATLVKKFPEQMAQMLAMRQAGGFRGAGGPGGAPGGGQTQVRMGEGGQPAAGGPGGQRAGGIDEMLERFPTITAADLKAGDIIAVSSTKDGALDRITAIKLLAGVEPFLRLAQAQTGGQRQGTQSLNIPGLDGFDGN